MTILNFTQGQTGIRSHLGVASLFAILILGFIEPSVAQCPQRYVDRVFTQMQARPNIVYGGNKLNVDGTRTWLAFDLYEPLGDTAQLRPVIMLLHGGAFTNDPPVGRKSPEIRELAKYLTRRGYVVISPSYRLYGSSRDNDVVPKTIVAAFIDIHDLYCWLSASVAAGNPYRLDTANFFMGGTSAGALLSLNFGGFFRDISQTGSPFREAITAVETFDNVNVEEILANKFCGIRPKGIIGISAGMYDTTFIESSDKAFYFIHGGLDRVTPYLQGTLLGMEIFGPGIFAPAMLELGIDVTLDYYPDAYHVPVLQPFGEELELALQQILATGSIFIEPVMGNTKAGIARFCHRIMGSPTTTCATVTAISENIIQGALKIFPNPTSGPLNIELPTELVNKEIRLSVFDINGRLLLDERKLGSSLAMIELPSFSKGMHVVSLSEWNNQQRNIYLEKVVVQ
jgi:hypothetical protein